MAEDGWEAERYGDVDIEAILESATVSGSWQQSWTVRFHAELIRDSVHRLLRNLPYIRDSHWALLRVEQELTWINGGVAAIRFDTACEAIGIEPDYLRRGILCKVKDHKERTNL